MQPLPVLYAQNIPSVNALIEHYKLEINAARLSAVGQPEFEVDWSNVITRFVASAVDLFTTFNGDPAQRKAAVIQAATQFYHDVIGPMVAAGVGRPFIFNTIINPAIERLLPKLIGGVYDAIAGIFDRKSNAGTTTQPSAPVRPGLPAGFTPY